MLPTELLGFLGLAQRAGKLIIGTTAANQALRRARNEILIIFAADFSASAREKVLAQASKPPHILEIGTKQEWGAHFGRDEVGVIAVNDKNFSAGIRKKLQV